MKKENVLKELKRIQESSYAKKTDKQLLSYEILSEMYKCQNKGIQPAALVKYNKAVNRQCKLSLEKVKEIRSKYNPYVYGKQKLAMEYGVSTSVIYRIIKRKAWKIVENSEEN